MASLPLQISIRCTPKNINPAKRQDSMRANSAFDITSELAVNPVSSLKSDRLDLKAMISGSFEKIPIILL